MLKGVKATTLKYRWFQFSLRTVLVIVTLFAITCSWFAVKMRQAKTQHDTVVAIEALGGRIMYLWQGDFEGKMKRPPTWLRRLFGEDFVAHVVFVDFTGTGVTDRGLEVVRGLNRLQRLHLGNTKITDRGLKCIEGLNELEVLSLDYTNITDAGLEHLKGMSRLQAVLLYGTQVTDKGANELQEALPDCAVGRF